MLGYKMDFDTYLTLPHNKANNYSMNMKNE